MHHSSTAKRTTPDPGTAFLRDVAHRLDALNELADPSAEEIAELGRLRVIWAHAQPTPVPRPPRRRGTPAELPDE